MERPDLLIEQWLPTKELGIESRREAAPIPGQFPKLKSLHVWWARRPLIASAGAVLASLLPSWSSDLPREFLEDPELQSEEAYRQWFLRLCGIWGDPVEAQLAKDDARARGIRLKENPFTYKQAFKNSPSTQDLDLFRRVAEATWGRVPQLVDPTAGGGSIPFEAARYGIPSFANDLNPVAVSLLRAGVGYPIRFGPLLESDLSEWGGRLVGRVVERMLPFFPAGEGETVTNYCFARTIACPRTGKPVPLAPNWWLSRKKGGVAVELETHRNGMELDEPEFRIVRGRDIDRRIADSGTISGGKAVSPWDQLVIDADYIRAEARNGRMGYILYGVVIRTSKGRDFRSPTLTDLKALYDAEMELQRLRPGWTDDDVVPDEVFPDGNDMRPVEFGMPRFSDMFAPRQLLVHCTFVEEFEAMVGELADSGIDKSRHRAIVTVLGLMVGKAVDRNSLLSTWDAGRLKTRNVFDRHDFAFSWTFIEFQGSSELYPWCLDQILGAYSELAGFLHASEGTIQAGASFGVPGPVVISDGNAGDLDSIPTADVECICIDPPYYDNVMYAELADFFYVWEKRTVGLAWPEEFGESLTNKAAEAVANDARFQYAGRRKEQLANLDYEKKMTAIFTECHRILMDRGVMTVMFTHKKAEAWDTLGQSLLEAGFSIEASWPVPTESAQSLHQAKKNSASSTIFLVCRKRPDQGQSKVFFDAIEAEVRHAARKAYSRMAAAGMQGVDLLLATYGPTLSVLSTHWPVHSSEPDADGQSRLLRPDEALLVAQEEVVQLELSRLVAHHVEFDALTDFWLLAWGMYGAREFPFDDARKLAFSVGGVDIDDVSRAKLLKKKSGSVVLQLPRDRYRKDPDSDIPGVNRERVVFPALIDALHTAMYVVDLDGAAAARLWLEQRQLIVNARMQALVEAAVAAVPRVREKGELTVEEAVLLERLVVAAFPDVVIPEEESVIEQEQLFDV